MKKIYILLSFVLLGYCAFSQNSRSVYNSHTQKTHSLYYLNVQNAPSEKEYSLNDLNVQNAPSQRGPSFGTSTLCDPPSNVEMIPFFLDLPFAGFRWVRDTTGLIDHYETFLNGIEVRKFGGWYWPDHCCEFVPGLSDMDDPMELNVFHDAGIVAVDTNGVVSDTVKFHFFFSETAYTRPTGVHIEKDFGTGEALLTWDEHAYVGGDEEPRVTDYSIYLDRNLVGSTFADERQFTYTNLSLGSNYVAGIITHFSDGFTDSTFYPNYSSTEFYMDVPTAPVHLAVDEATGVFTWSKPNNDGDVIGGTFTNYRTSISWDWSWPNPVEEFTTFGNERQFVRSRWALKAWSYGMPFYREAHGICYIPIPSVNYDSANHAEAGDHFVDISEITGTTGLEWDRYSIEYDAATNGGIGTYTVHKNETGYYGVTRLDSMWIVDGTQYLFGIDLTWWVQTDCSCDFSSAYNYYPNYYLIYLDGVLVDTVQPWYEEQFDNDYQYQFEGLIDGQIYTAGIQAVYHIGKSEIVTIDFSPTVGIEENSSSLSVFNIYPNPVTSQASISYALYEAGSVTIEILDVMGKKVKTLLNKNVTTGEHQISWDCKNDKGIKLLPGMYLCTLKTAHHVNSLRVLVN
jgi:hypothetical protein